MIYLLTGSSELGEGDCFDEMGSTCCHDLECVRTYDGRTSNIDTDRNQACSKDICDEFVRGCRKTCGHCDSPIDHCPSANTTKTPSCKNIERVIL